MGDMEWGWGSQANHGGTRMRPTWVFSRTRNGSTEAAKLGGVQGGKFGISPKPFVISSLRIGRKGPGLQRFNSLGLMQPKQEEETSIM